MARTLNKLSDVTAKAEKRAGRHSDGGGLYLNVSATGSKSWLFMWTPTGGKRKEMGLGSYPTMTLAKARARAAECRTAVQEGRDPIAEKAREAEPTFAECVERFLGSMEASWRNEKHRKQWRMTLLVHGATLGPLKVSQISTDDVLRVLTPLWSTTPETASRTRGRIERVLDFAKARGWRTGENPALWRGHLRNVLPAHSKLSRGHHAAMPYADIPALLPRLRAAEAMSARALEFLILTAARSGEVLGARWSEINLSEGVWTVPAARMKAGKEHRVPLPTSALTILSRLHEARASEFVFPGQRDSRPLSGMAMEMLLRRFKLDSVTVHGFRSAFRDWAGDETSFSREIAEAALAHQVGNETERAYRRSDALAQRRLLMEAWAGYLDNPEPDNVVKLRTA